MSKKTRSILYVLGSVVLVSSIFAFLSSIGTGFLTLFVGLVLISIPTISIFSKKTSASSSPYPSEPPKGYTPQKSVIAAASSPCSSVQSSAIPRPKSSVAPDFSYWKLSLIHDLPREYVCLDFETTGFDERNDRITEAAAVRVVDGEIVDRFSSLVKCERSIPPVVVEKTGITAAMLLDAPSELVVIKSLFVFIGDLPIAAYNAPFDLGFLHYAAWRYSMSVSVPVFDILQYARDNLPHDLPKKLSSVAEHLGVSSDQYHRALADAVTAARVAEAIRQIVAENERKKQLSERIAADAAIDYKSFSPSGEIDPNSPLLGKRVVFSGLLSRMSRRDACQIVADLGGQPWGSVTKGTAFLVTGEGEEHAFAEANGVSYKMRQAEEWRAKGSAIQTITETEFFDMLGL